jgi:thymidylate kinase
MHWCFVVFGDHWLGWCFQQMPAQWRSICIILDRTFDDLLIDPKRYRLDGAQAMVRLLRPFVPRPHLTFILDAPARVIHRRKPELSVEEVEEQCTAFRELAARDPRYIVVSTECSRDEVARVVCSHVIKVLSRAERRRGTVGP